MSAQNLANLQLSVFKSNIIVSHSYFIILGFPPFLKTFKFYKLESNQEKFAWLVNRILLEQFSLNKYIQVSDSFLWCGKHFPEYGSFGPYRNKQQKHL